MSIGKKRLIAGLIGASFALSAPAAFGQGQQMNPGWYVGGSLGQADLGPDEDTAWKIFGGYDINRNFAVELGYTDLGEVSEGAASVEANALELTALGKFPVGNQFSVYGLAGIARVDAEARGPGGTVSDDSNELTYGIGAQYDMSRNLGLRAQWQRYDTDEEVDVLSLGVLWKF